MSTGAAHDVCVHSDKPVEYNMASLNDLTRCRSEIERGLCSAGQCFQASRDAAESSANQHSYVRRFDAVAEAAARAVDAQHRAGAPLPPLAGLAVSVKDLFDVQGFVTTAGSRVLAHRPAASVDCPAVARLRRAGAALTGHTNLSERSEERRVGKECA